MSDDENADAGQRAPSDNSRSTPRVGKGEFDVIAPGLLHWRAAGYLRLEQIEPILFTANELIRNGYRPHLFIDGDDIEGYDTEVRKVFQGWALRNRAQIVGVWVLFRSPIVKMGLSIATAFTSGVVRGFGDADEFDQALTEATARAHAGEYRKSP
ncbi:MAG TPA: hypothetical protein VK034_27180 [Enhygromyxa sp.]|nr:hypothetical protein [Enhygromyxa sp.]